MNEENYDVSPEVMSAWLDLIPYMADREASAREFLKFKDDPRIYSSRLPSHFLRESHLARDLINYRKGIEIGVNCGEIV